MFIVTGGAGFVGSNLVRELNHRGHTDILVVDNLTRSEKARNLADLTLSDYLDKREFRARLDAGTLDLRPEAVFHNGACSDTMEADRRYMMENNYGTRRPFSTGVWRGRHPWSMRAAPPLTEPAPPSNRCPRTKGR